MRLPRRRAPRVAPDRRVFRAPATPRLLAPSRGVIEARPVTRDELKARGLSKDAIRRRVARGDLIQLHENVFADAGTLVDRGFTLHAALLAIGRDAALSCREAAEVRNLLVPSDRDPHITTTHRTGHTPAGIVPHRVRCIGEDEVEEIDGLRVVTVPRLLRELAAERSRELQRALNEAMYKRLVTIDELVPMAASGMPGCRVLRDALRYAAPTRSDLEDKFYALFVDANAPLPRANESVGLYEVDFIWRQERVIVETDGWAAHGHEFARGRRDPSKTRYLEALGYTVIRVSKAWFKAAPLEVLATILAALDRAR